MADVMPDLAAGEIGVLIQRDGHCVAVKFPDWEKAHHDPAGFFKRAHFSLDCLVKSPTTGEWKPAGGGELTEAHKRRLQAEQERKETARG